MVDPKASRDRDLLLAVVAVKNRFLDPQRLAMAAPEWTANPSRGLANVLTAQGHLSEPNRDLILALVAALIASNHGDVAKTLDAFGGARAVHESFAASIAPGADGRIESSLVSFGGGQNEATIQDPQDPARLLDNIDPITLEHPGRYLSQREYGRGGIGVVFGAYDQHIGREVAIKELQAGGAGGFASTPSANHPVSAAQRSRFLREARITAQLEHPGIVPVYEIAKRINGSIYYSMKLVRGQNLALRLKECQTLQDRLLLLHHFIDLCQAIAYAHAKGVIHRDLKPANVMLGNFGETLVIDWGLAKVKGVADERADEIAKGLQLAKDTGGDVTLEGQAMGTPSYMSPEQAEGQVNRIDERSDVWSLGAILYEILTGKPPFLGETAYDIIGKVINDPAPTVASAQSDAPPELAAVCEKCLSKDRDQRFKNSHELAEELIAVERSMLEKREREAKRNLAESYLILSRWAKSFKAYHNADVYCAKSLTVHDSIGSRVILNDLRLAMLDGDKLAPLDTHPADLLALAVSPDGKFLAAGTFDKLVKVYDLKRRSLVRVLTEHKDRVTALAFSPDGKYLISGSWDRTVRVWRMGSDKPSFTINANLMVSTLAVSGDGKFLTIAGLDKTIAIHRFPFGDPPCVLSAHKLPVTTVVFSPDSRSLASGANDSCLKIWDPSSGQLLRRHDWSTLPVTCLAFSPDSELLAAGGKDSVIRLYSRASDQPLVLRREPGEIYDLAFSPDGRVLASCGKDEDVNFWDPGSGKWVLSLKGHTESAVAIAFSPDGKLLASAGKDKTVRLWEVETGKLIITLSHHNGELVFIRFTQGGRSLLSAARDRVIRVWPLLPEVMAGDPAALLDEAEKRSRLKVVGMDLYQWVPQSGKVSDVPMPRPF